MESSSSRTVALTNPATSTATAASAMVLASSVTAFFEIRKCGREKKVKNCAYCQEYPCGRLSELFSKYSKAKETLDAVRRECGIT